MKPRLPEASKEIARQAYFSLPQRQRNTPNVLKALRQYEGQGFVMPSRGTIQRLIQEEWSQSIAVATAAFVDNDEAPGEADLSEVPDPMRDVLDARVLTTHGSGVLTREVEEMATKFARAIGRKAELIVDMLLDCDGDKTEVVKVADNEGTTTTLTLSKTNVARAAISAAAQISQMVQNTQQGRSAISISARNFAAVDKTSAEARAISEQGRAERAKEVGQSDALPVESSADAQAEVMAILRADRERK